MMEYLVGYLLHDQMWALNVEHPVANPLEPSQ
jgi:hypothetical protein